MKKTQTVYPSYMLNDEYYLVVNKTTYDEDDYSYTEMLIYQKNNPNKPITSKSLKDGFIYEEVIQRAKHIISLYRTFNEACEIVADLWLQEMGYKGKIFTQDNGTKNGDHFMMMNYFSAVSREKLTEENWQTFKTKLIEIMIGDPRFATDPMLNVDYHPCRWLAEALDKAGIPSLVVPIKSVTRIEGGNVVTARFGYSSEWKEY